MVQLLHGRQLGDDDVADEGAVHGPGEGYLEGALAADISGQPRQKTLEDGDTPRVKHQVFLGGFHPQDILAVEVDVWLVPGDLDLELGELGEDKINNLAHGCPLCVGQGCVVCGDIGVS